MVVARAEPWATRTRVSPLDVRFSQMKIRHLFGDGRRVADAVPLIRVERCTEEEAIEHGATWKLEAPFPCIEIIRWRCKLRDKATGRGKVDPDTGEELFDSQVHWFTLDNRRLYCLQEAALRVWPERCVVDVAEILSGPSSHMRSLRKFRTLDLGRGVAIGSRADGVDFVQWNWQAAIGIDDDQDPQDGRSVSGRGSSAPGSGGGGERRADDSVLRHLSSLQQGDYERIETSKRLSWILRRGARSLHVAIDKDGWVKVADLLELDVLNCRHAPKFLEMVTASNKQKRRYELKRVDEATFIRATGKVSSREAASRKLQREVPIASKVDAERQKSRQCGAQVGGSGVALGTHIYSEAGNSKAMGSLGDAPAGSGSMVGGGAPRPRSAVAPPAVTGTLVEGVGGSSVAADRGAGRGEARAGPMATVVAGGTMPRLEVTDAEAPPRQGVDSPAASAADSTKPLDRVGRERMAGGGNASLPLQPGATLVATLAAAVPGKGAATAATATATRGGAATRRGTGGAAVTTEEGKRKKGDEGKRPPPVFGGAPRVDNPHLASMIAMYQMQAMHQMHAMYQRQAMYSQYQMQAMHQMHAMRQMQALQQMQAMHEGQVMHELHTHSEEVSPGACDGSIEAKIQEARDVAWGRFGEDPEGPAAMIAEARDAAAATRERGGGGAVARDTPAAVDVVVRIAEAREAARGRCSGGGVGGGWVATTGSAAVRPTAGAAQGSAAGGKGVVADTADIEAKIAKALDAARERSGAKA